jgi:hypothetical protein
MGGLGPPVVGNGAQGTDGRGVGTHRIYFFLEGHPGNRIANAILDGKGRIAKRHLGERRGGVETRVE